MKERVVAAVYAGEATDELQTSIFHGHYQLVFLSPESLVNNFRWRDMLANPIYKENLVGLIVDEAHCVQKWYLTMLCFVCYVAFIHFSHSMTSI